ncbi:ABC transporter substrate-binding protein [Dechloromonas sp. XY25]|uniref:ABC transporter substrate-binding protein n=1 Tax=Dechloromonas hankyongensis TaxID=2908002 RepID=A0ABS9K226_9RHOO|nr:ABC transporter substrate-binding protein [Dechloromonas hankyongensis]MCG2577193.1 ABC transporter substrate-binding protein [Dechloromonas hankyongensis]
MIANTLFRKPSGLPFMRRVAALLAFALIPIMACGEVMQLSVSVPGPNAASYYPVELISKIGADKAEGATLRVVFSPGGPAAIDDMMHNNVDFAVVGLPAAMSVRLKDKRVVALAAINDLPLYVLLVRQGLKGEVKSIADLKGRTIGLHSNSTANKSTSQQVLELMFRRGGVPPGSYHVVGIGRRWESESLMLKSGAVDAVIGDEPHATHMANSKIAFPLVHLGDAQTARQYAGAGFLRGALIGRSDKLEKDTAKAETMIRIIKRTLTWIATHTPEEFANALGIADADEKQKLIAVLRKYPRQYSKDAAFSNAQLRETEIFFIDSQAGNPAAESFRIDTMIDARWVGKKD